MQSQVKHPGMSCSLEQFEKLIEKQCEVLAKQRIQERSEDLAKFSEVIKASVRDEVRDALDPITKRQEAFEVSSKERQEAFEVSTKEQFHDMAKEIADLKKIVANPNRSEPPPPHYPPSTALHPSTDAGVSAPADITTNLSDVIEKAERTVGFQPLYEEDVKEICRVHNITDTELAMKMLVLEYLKFEMKNTDTQLSNIVRVFHPVKNNWNTLYAEFDTRVTTRNVYGFTRFLRDSQHRVSKYIPHVFYDQFDHLSKLAYRYRLPPSNHKTRINFGTANMFLQVKPPGSAVWQVVPVDDLPPLNSREHPPYLSLSPTPAPGRRPSSVSKRAASSSPESAPSSKSARSSVGTDLVEQTHTDDLISLDTEESHQQQHFL